MTESDRRAANLDATALAEDRYTQGAVEDHAQVDAHELEPIALRDSRMIDYVDSVHWVDENGNPSDPTSQPMADVDDPAYRDDDWDE